MCRLWTSVGSFAVAWAYFHAMDPAKLRRIAARQLGLFTRAQAMECGFSARQIRWRVDAGEWQRVLGRVLAPAGLPLSPLVLDRAGPLAVIGGVIAGQSAARTWGMVVPATATYLAISRERNPSLRGITYLRTDVERREIYGWEGAAVTSAPRTVSDCLRILPEMAAVNLLDQALQRNWVTLPYLIEQQQRWTGFKGSAQSRRLIQAASKGTHSAGERLAAKLLTSAGIRLWRANVAIHDADGLIGIGDFVFDAERLVLEIDGMAHHVTAQQFQRDRERQNRLVAAGWTVLRFTWWDLDRTPGAIVATVEQMLRRLRGLRRGKIS